MSYILDALQRADAERERGGVPGLHARQVTSPPQSSAAAAKTRLWLALAAAVGLGALATSLWLGRSGKVMVALQPAPAVAASPEPVAAPMASQSRSAAAIAIPLPLAAEKITPVPQAKASASVRDEPPLALPWLAELPQETRSQVPPLAITGVVYSDNPAQRLLLINGQVLPPGSAVTPEVTLEDIREHHSVLSFHGTRFRVAH
jgi:general secretion pathway protein B